MKKIPGNPPMIPRVFLQGVDGGNVIGRNPAYPTRGRASLAPFTVTVVTQDTDSLPL